MSNRIIELAGLALDQAVPETYADINREQLVRFQTVFAEMIVRECAEVAGCNSHVQGFALGDLIKQHFGVEV